MRGTLVGALVVGAATLGRAQAAPGPVCDSIVAAAKVDEARAGIFLTVRPLTPNVDAARARHIVANVGTGFVPPRPFKLSVFAGPSLVRGLRLLGADSTGTLRAPVVTGIYRASMTADDSMPRIQVVRRSLVDGFDSAAVAAIRDAATVPGVFAVGSGNPLAFELRFTTDSEPGAQRLFAASFPRLRVKDAEARADSPAPKYPDDDSGQSGQVTVVLRFVVARDGVAEPGTIEVIRRASEPFMNAALQALEKQRFVPATVKDCPVAQQVDYPFAFFPSEGVPQGLTRSP